jgi:hypothetical protein
MVTRFQAHFLLLVSQKERYLTYATVALNERNNVMNFFQIVKKI